MGSSVEKILEHVRQIHFVFAVTLALLAYITVSTSRDRPDLIGELDRLDAILSVVAAASEISSSTTVPDGEKRAVAVAAMATLNQAAVDVVRSELRLSISKALHVIPVEDEIDHMAFQPLPRFPGAPDRKKPVRSILKELEGMKVEVFTLTEPHATGPIAWEVGSPGSTHAAASLSSFDRSAATATYSVQKYEGRAKPVGKEMVALSPVPHGRPVLISLKFKPMVVSLESTADFLKTNFPVLTETSPLMKEYSIDRLREIAKTTDERVFSGKSAKIFDIEVQNRDMGFVAAAILCIALLYLTSYSRAAARLIETEEAMTAFQVAALQSVWLGSHTGRLHVLVDASFVAAVLVTGYAGWFVFKLGGGTVAVLLPVTIAASIAIHSKRRLRRTLISAAASRSAAPPTPRV